MLANDHLSDDLASPFGVTYLRVDTGPDHGHTVVNNDKTITYTPDPGFSGTDTFGYEFYFGSGGESDEPNTYNATVTVTVTPSTTPLVATNDAPAPVIAGQPFPPINVLANDTYTLPITITLATAPSHGSVSLNPDNTVAYVPAANFAGTDSFTYTLTDSHGQTSAPATVTLTLNAPTLKTANDLAATPAGQAVTINVLANDLPAGELTLTQVDAPAHGSAQISNNQITYTPASDFASPPTDTFTYTVQDRYGQTATATVTVTVNPPGLNPVADTATTSAGQMVTINVLANDTPAGTLTLSQVGTPTHGSAKISGNSIIYIPEVGFASPPTDTFTYTVKDRYNQTATATVTVTVNPPGLYAGDDSATTQAGQAITINVLANDSGENITLSSVGAPANGNVQISGDNLIYTPKVGFSSPPNDSFTYTLTDHFGQTATATVQITVKPPTLSAINDATTTPARTTVTIPVLANDGGTGLTVIGVSAPAHGNAAISTAGTIIYTPASNFAGTDSFTYTIRDTFGQTATATVRVTIIAPTIDAVDDTAEARTATPVTIPVLANDIGAGLSITQVSSPAHGSAQVAANGSITYTSAAKFTGADAFNYTITDGISSDTATVTIKVNRTKEDAKNLLKEATQNPNVRQIADAIGGLCFERAATTNFLRDCDDLIDAASKGNPGVGTALEQITPAALGSALDRTASNAQLQMQSILTRMASLRSGINGINFDLNIQHGGWTLSGSDLRYMLASLGGGGPSAEVSPSLGPLGIFASGTFNLGNRDSTEKQPGYDFKSREVTVGADYRFTDQLALGTALSLTSTDADPNNTSGYLNSRGYGLTLYGTYYPSEQFYMDGMIGYGWNDYDQRRGVVYRLTDIAVNQYFDSSYGGQQFFADLGIGYEFTYGDLTFGPEARLSYVDTRIDSFKERASNNAVGSGWAVALEEQNSQSLVSSLGGRAKYLIAQPWGSLQPQAEFSWLHEFNEENRFIRGHFLEGALIPDNIFQLAMDPADTNYFRWGVGLGARFNRGPAALIRYRTLFNYKNLESHAITAELRWEF